MKNASVGFTKREFLSSEQTISFLEWLENVLDQPGSLSHAFFIKRLRMNWRCDCLYNAYENYRWPFQYHDPITGEVKRGETFVDCFQALDTMRVQLQQGFTQRDEALVEKTCLSVLEWGGVLSQNRKTIETMSPSFTQYLLDFTMKQSKDLRSNEFAIPGLHMNSGFTKVYSLCAETFYIYDGRLGAALGWLVRQFCEASGLLEIPLELRFAWGRGRGDNPARRNPSTPQFRFPELGSNRERHLENNIRANWLIERISDTTESRFQKIPKKMRGRALESALFMVGYEIGNCN